MQPQCFVKVEHGSLTPGDEGFLGSLGLAFECTIQIGVHADLVNLQPSHDLVEEPQHVMQDAGGVRQQHALGLRRSFG